MNDMDGVLVTKALYGRLMSKDAIDVDDIAYALDSAISELRNNGVPLHRWAPYIHLGA
jgi:hypothetical protein